MHTFCYAESRDLLAPLFDEHDFALTADGKAFEASTIRVRPPLVQPIQGRTPAAWLAALPPVPGPSLVVLLQAGAAALGRFEAGEVVRHKAFKRYVVRGKGKAQPAHLRTRGKSRYGSRLRLQNAKRLLEDVCERITAWDGELGSPELLFRSCPIRIWPALFKVEPGLPYERRSFVKVPLDVHVPCFAELERVWKLLCRGTID